MKRLLLLALTAGFLSPIAARAEGDFTELEFNPYSYQPSSAFRWWKEGKRYISFKGTTQRHICFARNEVFYTCMKSFWDRGLNKGQVTFNKKNQAVWNFDVDCMDKTFNRGGDFMPWNLVHMDPTAEIVANKYCPLNNWNKLPQDTTK